MALPAPSPDTTVVVTGASAGIGEALARELAARGHGLTLVARDRSRLDELAGSLPVSTRVLAADLADDDARAGLLASLQDGPVVAGLVNNAGVAAFGSVLDHDVAREEVMVRTNVLALFDLTNRLVRGMVERGSGAVLNLSSIVAFAPQPRNATYGATKAFIASYGEALHVELAGTGVSCTSVHPGPVRTGLWADAGEPNAVGRGGSVVWSRPEDVARAAVDGMVAGRRSVTPGLTAKAMALGYRLAPRAGLLPAIGVAQSDAVRRFVLGRGSEGGN